MSFGCAGIALNGCRKERESERMEGKFCVLLQCVFAMISTSI